MSTPRWHFYDKSGKWLIDHHGDSILRLARVANIEWWRAAQADVVQPEQLPDGLLEVKLAGQTEPSLFVVELATYPEQRLIEQLIRDVTLVYLAREQLPEAIAVILHPKGKLRIPEVATLSSAQGLTHWQLRWRIVELWTVPAELLLAAQDVGLIPWVPLAQSEDAPDVLLHKCRERIDALAPAHERTQLAGGDAHSGELAI